MIMMMRITHSGRGIYFIYIRDGSLKKESVIIIPKLTAIDASLILGSRFIASLHEKSFEKVKKELCLKLGC